jgi:hypothetical protein
MNQWYKNEEELTHYCRGSENKENNNKPSGTHTERSYWFYPTKVEGESIQCLACGSVFNSKKDTLIYMGE